MNSLSTDCLFAIFDCVPIPELLSLRVLNSTWNLLINDHCHRTRSLQLFGSWYDRYRHQATVAKRHFSYSIDFGSLKAQNAMIILKSNQEAALQPSIIIPDTFPKIRNLMVNNCQELYEQHLPAMLKRWPQLITLSLHSIPCPEKLHPLFWTSINALKSLRHLYLVHMYSSVLPAELPVLKDLCHFALVHYRGPVAPILAQLGSNCQSIVLCWVYLNYSHFETLLRLNPKLVEGLEHLTLEYINCSSGNRVENFKSILCLVANHFNSLKSLNIMLADSLMLSTLVPILSKFTRLTNLTIYICKNQVDSPASQLSPLFQVTDLAIEVFGLTLSQFEETIPVLFPNLKKLTIKSDYENQREMFHHLLKRNFENVQVFEVWDY